MKKKHELWTGAELNRLRELYKTHNFRECAEILGRRPESVKNALARNKIKSGRSGQFPKGNIPWSAGTKGMVTGGKETQFKKGSQPANKVPVGTVRKHSDGYFYVKTKAKWEFLHREIWRLMAGEIPKNKIVVFRDRNPGNCRFENLELITRAEHARRNMNYRKSGESLKKLWDREKQRLDYGLPPASGFGEILRRKEKRRATSTEKTQAIIPPMRHGIIINSKF